jgi:hypothetical protein
MIGNRSYQKFTDAIRKDHKINDLILGLKSPFGVEYDGKLREYGPFLRFETLLTTMFC